MRIAITLPFLFTVVIGGCVNQADVKDKDRQVVEFGGIETAGFIEQGDALFSETAEQYGQDLVGVRWLNEEDKLSSWRYLRLADRQVLYTNDLVSAEETLSKVLYKYPHSKTAAALINQIENAPEKYFTSKNISIEAEDEVIHRVKDGENIHDISKKYYGTSDYYIALLRYNKMLGEVTEGNELRIPGGKSTTRKRKTQKVTSEAREKPAHESQAAVTSPAMDTIEVDPNDESIGNSEAVDSTNMILFREGDTNAASENELAYINDESALNSEDAGNSPFDIEIDDILASQDIDEQTDELQEQQKSTISEQEEIAFALYADGKYSRSLFEFRAVDNPSDDALRVIEELKHRLIDQPYEKGLQFYQKQRLELAINQFDLVLENEPQHPQALLYKHRCQQLLEQLQKL